MKRSLLALCLLGATVCTANEVVERYQRSCAVCHEQGFAGAPKRGDVQAWGPRLDKGMDALLQSTVAGYRSMPPRGTCIECSDADFIALIEYMSQAQSE